MGEIMLESELKLRQKVRISTSCEYYVDYRDEILTIVGLNIDRDDNYVDITLTNGNWIEDGWKAIDLVTVEDFVFSKD